MNNSTNNTAFMYRRAAALRRLGDALWLALGLELPAPTNLQSLLIQAAEAAGGGSDEWEESAEIIYGTWTDDPSVDPLTDIEKVAFEIVVRSAEDLGAGNTFDLATGNEFAVYRDALENLHLQIPQLIDTYIPNVNARIDPSLGAPSSVYGYLRYQLDGFPGSLGPLADWTALRANLAATTLDGGYSFPDSDPATDNIGIIVNWLNGALPT